jgi:predicted acetyltransferase
MTAVGHHAAVPSLIDPDARLRESFLAAAAEFRADASYPVPWFITDIDPLALIEPDAFRAYVDRVLRERDEATPRPAHFVPMTTLWWADGDQMLGRLAIRHRLTPLLEQSGGHIGYDVRPSARRQGHAIAMLAAALPLARSLGIADALLTCLNTNIGSRRVIEANGGRFIGMSGPKRRYLIATG